MAPGFPATLYVYQHSLLILAFVSNSSLLVFPNAITFCYRCESLRYFEVTNVGLLGQLFYVFSKFIEYKYLRIMYGKGTDL